MIGQAQPLALGMSWRRFEPCSSITASICAISRLLRDCERISLDVGMASAHSSRADAVAVKLLSLWRLPRHRCSIHVCISMFGPPPTWDGNPAVGLTRNRPKVIDELLTVPFAGVNAPERIAYLPFIHWARQLKKSRFKIGSRAREKLPDLL